MSAQVATRTSQYINLRKTATRFASDIASNVPTDVLRQAAQELDLLKNNRMRLKFESEADVLMDHALHAVTRGGESVFRLIARSHPSQPGSRERTVLDAMADARYSLYITLRCIDELSCEIFDVFRGWKGEVVDFGFAVSARPGYILAGRLVAAPDADFWISTGATLPVDETLYEPILKRLVNRFGSRVKAPARLNRAEWAELATVCTRQLLRGGAAERVRYLDPDPEMRALMPEISL